MISQTDLAYIAGFFDGEGSVYTNKWIRGGRTPVYGVSCSVTNTDRTVLDWMCRIFKVGVVSCDNSSGRKANWKPAYKWIIHTHDIKGFLDQLMPFLRLKKERAELALEFLTLCYYHGRTPVPEKDIILREVIYQEMRELNKRGT